MQKKPRKKAGQCAENVAAITDFWLVLFSAAQATRCHQQLGGQEDLHLPEGLAHPEHYRRYSGSDSRSRPQPMLERSVPATGPITKCFIARYLRGGQELT